MKNETMAKAISNIIENKCPAFLRINKGAAEWHGCLCLAQQRCGDILSSCTCVWHLTDKCVVGQWKSLAFVREAQEKRGLEAEQHLLKAQEACSRDNSC